jgi:hypothetical protein
MDLEETEARSDCAGDTSSNLTDRPTNRRTDGPTELQSVLLDGQCGTARARRVNEQSVMANDTKSSVESRQLS